MDGVDYWDDALLYGPITQYVITRSLCVLMWPIPYSFVLLHFAHIIGFLLKPKI